MIQRIGNQEINGRQHTLDLRCRRQDVNDEPTAPIDDGRRWLDRIRASWRSIWRSTAAVVSSSRLAPPSNEGKMEPRDGDLNFVFLPSQMDYLHGNLKQVVAWKSRRWKIIYIFFFSKSNIFLDFENYPKPLEKIKFMKAWWRRWTCRPWLLGEQDGWIIFVEKGGMKLLCLNRTSTAKLALRITHGSRSSSE